MTNRFAAATLVAVSFLVAPMTWAQSDETVVVSIEQSQPLSDALQSFADQADLQVIFFADITEGKVSSGLEGEYAVDAALDTLLADTGLGYTFIDDTAVSIQVVATDSGGDSNRKNSATTTVLMAQNARPTPATASGLSNSDVTTVLTGKVIDARTSANLKGAKVLLVELGWWTSTNDLGEFRFPAMPVGTYTVRASYLGYEEISETVDVRLDGTNQDLRMVSTFDEIVVMGTQSGRMQALNLERTSAVTSTVLNADQLGTFNGITVSDALRRAPGIAFIPDPDTGDGAQVIVRGVEPDLNQVTLNGVRLLDGTGLGRSPDLSNILTENIERVTINKSLLPSHDSNGAGALVEIETKSPLDRERRFASFGLEYGESSGSFSDEFGVNATLSGKLGADEDFGASISVSYREQDTNRLSYGVGDPLPAVLPAVNSVGNPVFAPVDVNPLNTFPFDDGFDELYPLSVSAAQGTTERETLSITSSIEKEVGDHTSLQFDVFYTENSQTVFNSSTAAFNLGLYDSIAVDGLSGDVRPGLVGEDVARNNPNPFFPVLFGDGILGGVIRESTYVPDQESAQTTLSFRGSTARGAWDFDYKVGYSLSESDTPESFQVFLGTQQFGTSGAFNLFSDIGPRSFFSEEALANTTADGRIVSIFPALGSAGSGDFILPLFSEEGFDFYNSLDSFPLRYSRTGPRSSEGEELDFGFDARRSFDSNVLRYVQFGVAYRETEFFSPGDRGFQGLGLGFGTFDGAVIPGSDPAERYNSEFFGLALGPGLLTRVGAGGDFAALTRGSVEQFVANAASFELDGLVEPLVIVDGNLDNSRRTQEDILNAYVEVELEFNKLQIIGGVRIESIDVGSSFFTAPRVRSADDGSLLLDPNDVGQIVSGSVSQTEVLPRVLANYRFDDNRILRAGYYTTVSRPQLENLTARQDLSLDLRPTSSSTGDRPLLEVSQGNPDLKPAISHNFGLDFEYYTDDVGVVKASAFYKRIENPLQTNRTFIDEAAVAAEIELPDLPFFNDLPEPLEVIFEQPVNAESDDEIWGIELTAERQLAMLPGLWSGLGIYANYTYTDSETTQRLTVLSTFDERGFVEFEGVPFTSAPKHQGTFGLTYRRHGLDSSLLYSAQDRRLDSIRPFDLNLYNETVETLDFRVDYITQIGGVDYRIYFRAEDLLSDKEDPFLQTSLGGESGVPQYVLGSTYFGGRRFFTGVSVLF